MSEQASVCIPVHPGLVLQGLLNGKTTSKRNNQKTANHDTPCLRLDNRTSPFQFREPKLQVFDLGHVMLTFENNHEMNTATARTPGEIAITSRKPSSCTKVFGICRGEITKPAADKPNQGRINFNVEFSGIADSAFQPLIANGEHFVQSSSSSGGQQQQNSPNSVNTVCITNRIERILKQTNAIDEESLCLVSGEKCWELTVTVIAINNDGNLVDACVLAGLLALKTFRKEQIQIVEDGSLQVFTKEEREPIALNIHHLPIPVSFGVVSVGNGLGNGGSGRNSSSRNNKLFLADMNRQEELLADGVVTLAVNQFGEICGTEVIGAEIEATEIFDLLLPLAVERSRALVGFLDEKVVEFEEHRRKVRMKRD
ncbi:unnamed protein product [Amoebophrya sp. A120]|nr:unnamed protein product [Amoebophrya sp. A120]|eukprot:GSA120T00006770001.1